MTDRINRNPEAIARVLGDELPPLSLTRKIRACEGEAAAQLLLERHLEAARASLLARIAELEARNPLDNSWDAAESARRDRAAAVSQWRAAKKRAEKAEAEVERLRELLQGARDSWIKVGYGASHEDVNECRDFCERISAELKERT
jgi:hypothetical protein